MKRKVIFAAGAHSRCGSSATMGLLKLAGVDIGGRYGKINPPGYKNPKGHFELRSIEYDFYRKHFKEVYFTNNMAPPIHVAVNKAPKIKDEFKKIIDLEFGNCKTIALKGMGSFFLPIVHFWRHIWDIHVIVLHRNVPDRARSVVRVWDHVRPQGHPETYEKVEQELISWDALMNNMMQRYPHFKYMHINFEDLIAKPIPTAHRIYTFVGIPPLANHEIAAWIDKRIVNRKKI